MKQILILFMFANLLFGQTTSEEKNSTFCNPKIESLYYKLTNKPFVKIEDRAISEITKGLSTLGVSKRTVTTKDSTVVFIHFKVYTFLSQNSSKYLTYENSLTLNEAKTYLLDLINMEEEYRKNQVSKKSGYYSSFNNTPIFIRSGYEYLKTPLKTPSGQNRKDKNGDDILRQIKSWFIDIDTTCRDIKTKYEIEDILSYIELIRNTINS
jgi:hypothetical protein